MSNIIGSSSSPRNVSLIYYTVGAKSDDFDSLPWPSGNGYGNVPYDYDVFYCYEGNTGGWPSYLYNGQITNGYILASHGVESMDADGMAIVDRYGGIEPYITGIHLPAIASGLNDAFENSLEPMGFAGKFIIDFETNYPIWFARNTGQVGTHEHAWQEYYNSTYGYDPHASGIWLTWVRRLYHATIDEFRYHIPLAKISWYSWPNTLLTHLTNPAIFNETTGSIQAKHDLNNDIFEKLDFLSCQVYNNLGYPLIGEPYVPGVGAVLSKDFCTAFNNVCSEFSRVAVNNNKHWIAILQPVYPPGRPELVHSPVRYLDHDLISQICLQHGASGLSVWMSVPDSGVVVTGSPGIANINLIFQSISERFSNVQNPENYSNLWDSPW